MFFLTLVRHVIISRLPSELLTARGLGRSESNMADHSETEKDNFAFPNQQIPLSSIIPAVQEARRHRPPFVPSVGLPNVLRTPQELMVERVMENCAFKSVLAGVVGNSSVYILTFCFNNVVVIKRGYSVKDDLT